ncbi:hypothetical protein [Dyadobacter sp. CY326]|uniref:hypothetical protein n=1 Tax=Dyadobacter sp. CY326 TaxID=2907300 RepID=UPI001F38457E|nr:hypothetical protein [Dyadobacter sp. CY326]MCE7065820.1 hypothetical protein [Dyadobacter sp. CY326]
MKNLLRFVAWLAFAFVSLHCHAQSTFTSTNMQCRELRIANITFDSSSGNVYRIPLRKYGLRKCNYAVMVKASLDGDPASYHIPGSLPNGDSFSFKIKSGGKRHGDTLMIIRRSGNERVQFSKISILAFRGLDVGAFVRNDKAFRKFFLATYVPSYHSGLFRP